MNLRASQLSVFLLLLSAAGALPVRAEVLPPPTYDLTLPPPAANAFGVSVAFGPSDGLLYVWDGASVLKQDAPLSGSFTSIGNVGSGSSDAGPVAFSRDGDELLLGNGAGGALGGANADLIFSIPAAGGDGNVAIGTVPYHARFLAAPLGASNDLYFINQGNASFSASSVSVFDATDGSNVSVIADIPGASTAMAVDALDRLFVGVGFGPQRGQLRSFALSDIQTAYDTTAPLNWTSGDVFNAADNNSGAGLFFDARGYLFAGGPSGVTVFGNGIVETYENNGFTLVDYDPVNDLVLVTGFGDHQGLYPASMFLIPEPSALLLAACWLAVFLPAWRRRHRRWA
ncbi:MAG: hypothetical protein DWQ37_13465 [Planctomycetota bacterium]|nr:MAG: hypothetical protein DWQ37_13465 [Planctomycetota bacterium]